MSARIPVHDIADRGDNGDVHLTAHGVDGDDGALESPGLGELIEEIWDGGDRVGFLGDASLGEDPLGRAGVGAEDAKSRSPSTIAASQNRSRHGITIPASRPKPR